MSANCSGNASTSLRASLFLIHKIVFVKALKEAFLSNYLLLEMAALHGLNLDGRVENLKVLLEEFRYHVEDVAWVLIGDDVSCHDWFLI